MHGAAVRNHGRARAQRMQETIAKRPVTCFRKGTVDSKIDAYTPTAAVGAGQTCTAQRIATKLSEKYDSLVKVEVLERYLEGYDKEKKDYLIKGFREGFELEFKGQNRN